MPRGKERQNPGFCEKKTKTVTFENENSGGELNASEEDLSKDYEIAANAEHAAHSRRIKLPGLWKP